MNKKIDVSLIDGTFSVSEANEVLMSLFSSKIQFHEMKIFSSRERFGIDDEHSVKRIPSLLESKSALAALIHESSKQPIKMRITSTVQVEIIAESTKECSPAEKSL
jgi:hypothetical protein